MEIAQIHVQNFRALRDIKASLSNFACVIGENNAGKSSFLQAFISFLKGSKLNKDDYYDESEPVTIAVQFDDLTDEDLQVLAEEHRRRVNSIIENGSLTLVRRFPRNERPLLRCKRLLPQEERWRESVYVEKLKGTKGRAIQELISSEYPELLTGMGVDTITTQTKAKEIINEYANSLPPEEKVLDEVDLPSGIAASVTALLPEPIFVEAVKDLSDEVKTTQQATFGKLLEIMLDAIEPEFQNVNELFYDLQKHLNRIYEQDGSQIDDRLPDVKRIENMIQHHLHETFANVALELNIPPPDMKSILSNASFDLDDGVKGDTSTKGDGLRRAVTFAIFRSLAELSAENKQDSASRRNRFLFLFEEPELYLHPIAQIDLFDALSQISDQNQVILTTHSPYFFRPDNTDRFIKVKKSKVQPKPISEIIQFDLRAMNLRDLFQIISFETSNTAFFARKVVLVEGESELFALPHIAQTLNKEWDLANNHISLLKIGGKGNIRRFKDFFEAFEVPVLIIADLDILVNGFDQLEIDNDIRQLQSALLQKTKAMQEAQESAGSLVGVKKAKKKIGRGDQNVLWSQVASDYKLYREDASTIQKVVESFESFVETLRIGDRRIDIISDNDNVEILQLKRELLAKLRCKDIYVWEKGTLEDYYPDNISASDGKPQQALDFCDKITCRQDMLELSDQLLVDGKTMSEFEVVFSSIFDDTAPI